MLDQNLLGHDHNSVLLTHTYIFVPLGYTWLFLNAVIGGGEEGTAPHPEKQTDSRIVTAVCQSNVNRQPEQTMGFR